MKIRIEFTNKEKVAMMLATSNSADYDEYCEGNFGKAEYSSEKNTVDINLKEEFTVATATVIGKVIDLIKPLVKLFDDYSNEWFSNTKGTRQYQYEKYEKASSIYYKAIRTEEDDKELFFLIKSIKTDMIQSKTVKSHIKEMIDDLYNRRGYEWAKEITNLKCPVQKLNKEEE